MSPFNVIMMRTFISTNISDTVIEAARIDGESEFGILFRIVLPMSAPILATVGLFSGLGYWNDWMNGLYYINNDRLYGIQVLLMKILRNLDSLRQNAAGATGELGALPSVSIRMAIAVVGILPVMAAYPFLQKYFVKGISIGAVKG